MTNWQLEKRWTRLNKKSGRIANSILAPKGCQVQLIAYGVKHGRQNGCDLAYDVRSITNPHHDKKLRALTGFDQPVRDEVMGHGVAKRMLNRILSEINEALKLSKSITVGIYCIGGRHRSVAMTMAVGEALIEKGISVETLIRDREKWKE